jgi:hypothetical protein
VRAENGKWITDGTWNLTSGLTSFERTPAFYRKCGYEEEARVREFYEAGEDKVVFRKGLTAPGSWQRRTASH